MSLLSEQDQAERAEVEGALPEQALLDMVQVAVGSSAGRSAR
ncbi:MAG TPA: hypothetical protein VFA46_05470 [Actinomycetes bacterium]|jgi:hypothetical protein|nr:hypothetical protein [Actinomycetes bacterium]